MVALAAPCLAAPGFSSCPRLRRSVSFRPLAVRCISLPVACPRLRRGLPAAAPRAAPFDQLHFPRRPRELGRTSEDMLLFLLFRRQNFMTRRTEHLLNVLSSSEVPEHPQFEARDQCFFWEDVPSGTDTTSFISSPSKKDDLTQWRPMREERQWSRKSKKHSIKQSIIGSYQRGKSQLVHSLSKRSQFRCTQKYEVHPCKV